MVLGDGNFALFDGDGGSATLLLDYRRCICINSGIEGCTDARSVASVFELIEAAQAQGEWVALAADYALGSCFEPAAIFANAQPGRLRAWVFGQRSQLDALAVQSFLDQQLDKLTAQERAAGIAELSSAMDAEIYARQVDQVRHWISDGDCYQINLTFPLDFKVFGHPLALYARLRERQPVRYGAYVATPEATVISCSPELFFERSGSRVVTRPMKGTARRGATPEEDEVQRRALLASEKERAENIMIVDLLRNDLGRLAKPGRVRVDTLCAAEAYPTLWQVVSTVSAELPNVRLFELFSALFPCGSITGAPKIRAMQRIAELESDPRGLYTGALGWVAPDGDCRFNVAIRTFEVGQDKRARLGVGSGIVIDSNPAAEYAECLLKARFLTGFDPGFELIETMRLQHGSIALLALHLQRLETSARMLGFCCDVPGIAADLAQQSSNNTEGVFRVRLSLAHDGRFVITVALLEEVQRDWQVVLAAEKLDVDDYLLGHKTTARSRYDHALAALADTPEVFDALFFNSRDELCEGARSTVLIERDGVWLTPPLSCGLLPGVMRRHLLESGRAVECVLRREDLLGASSIYVANALRGVMPVKLKIDRLESQ